MIPSTMEKHAAVHMREGAHVHTDAHVHTGADDNMMYTSEKARNMLHVSINALCCSVCCSVAVCVAVSVLQCVLHLF